MQWHTQTALSIYGCLPGLQQQRRKEISFDRRIVGRILCGTELRLILWRCSDRCWSAATSPSAGQCIQLASQIRCPWSFAACLEPVCVMLQRGCHGLSVFLTVSLAAHWDRHQWHSQEKLSADWRWLLGSGSRGEMDKQPSGRLLSLLPDWAGDFSVKCSSEREHAKSGNQGQITKEEHKSIGWSHRNEIKKRKASSVRAKTKLKRTIRIIVI